MTEHDEASDLTNKSVVKAGLLLEELGNFPAGVTATELAGKARMSRPTVFRLLLSLAQTGLVEKVDGRYRLGWKMARLGRRADPHGGLLRKVQPLIEELADRLNEMIGYGVVNGPGQFDLVAEASAKRLISLSQSFLGRSFPVHASAMGKLALADLDDADVRRLLPSRLQSLTPQTITDREVLIRQLHEVRELGFAIIEDELEDSLFAIAVSVRDGSGRMLGMLAATGPTARMKRRDGAALVSDLRAAAATIAAKLAGE